MKATYLVTAAIVPFIAAPGAWAQSPAGSTYGGQGKVVTDVATGPRQDVAGQSVSPPGASVAPETGTAAARATTNAARRPARAGTNAARSVEARGAPTGERAVRPLRGRSLPFTGLDVLLVLMGGGALVAVGIGTRGLARHVV